MSGNHGFIGELRRRKVLRTGALYSGAAVASWGGVEIAVQALGLPTEALTFVVAASIGGFPLALVLSWFYEIRREVPSPRVGSRLRSPVLGVATWVVGASFFGIMALAGAEESGDPSDGTVMQDDSPSPASMASDTLEGRSPTSPSVAPEKGALGEAVLGTGTTAAEERGGDTLTSIVPFVAALEAVEALDVHPDGKRLLMTTGTAQFRRISLASTIDASVREVFAGYDVSDVRWFGDSISFRKDHRIYLSPSAEGGNPRLVVDLHPRTTDLEGLRLPPHAYALSPDGGYIAATGRTFSSGFLVYSLQEGEAEDTIELDLPAGSEITELYWGLDGDPDHVFTVAIDNDAVSSIHRTAIGSGSTTEILRVTNDSIFAKNLSWSGRRLYFQLGRVLLSVDPLDLPHRSTSDEGDFGRRPFAQHCSGTEFGVLSLGGRIAYTTPQSGRRIRILEPSACEFRYPLSLELKRWGLELDRSDR